ncbi:MAG: L-serine ammonia-lyase, iron-sulfur-dependent, subunit alpha [Angelakisella sp.]
MTQAEKDAIYGILREELVPAMGCTEPIAIAYAAAKARALLAEQPTRAVVKCSGNIIKNVKAVVVPNSGGLRGLETCVTLGAIGGNAEKQLEVLEDIQPIHIEQTKRLLAEGFCTVEKLDTAIGLHLIVELYSADHHAAVEIAHSHTNIVSMMVDGNAVEVHTEAVQNTVLPDRSFLNIRLIYDFANEADLAQLEELLRPQIRYNTDIAEEGLKNEYGACVGASLLRHFGNDVTVVAKAMAAAGSDARMSGCPMPVVINSGSGNQGMTVSLPVIAYAQKLGASDEMLLRALALSNLVALHQKTRIGKLSAYCGVVSAATGSGAAISYLHGMPYEDICKTITNTLANVSGIICDGAKPSCAAKIASAVDAAIMGHLMAMDHHTFGSGEGLVKDDVEQTIACIGTMGRNGMRETDQEILRLMLQ